MRTTKVLAVLFLAIFVGGVVVEPGWAAMQIRKKPTPSKPATQSEAKSAPSSGSSTAAPAKASKSKKKKKTVPTTDAFAGNIIFVRGKKVLAEVPGGAKAKERFVLYDVRLRRTGSVRVIRAMDDDVYLLKMASGSASEGDRLARETEDEAYARVKRSKSSTSYIEFLEVFPESRRRPVIARALFRSKLRDAYQTFPGTTITGKVELKETVGLEIGMARAMIKIDRFVIGMTDDTGEFRIEGIPQFDYPVKVKIKVRDEKFAMAEDVILEIPANKVVDLTADLSVNLTPTYLVGTVVDEQGHPIREAEVWTSPYTMEVLTDEHGQYRIWRTKKLDASGATLEGDEPLMGHDYEVYAYRKGFGAEKVSVSAESFMENEVKSISLTRGDSIKDGVPDLDIDLRANLDLMQFVVPAGSGPKINQ